MENNNMKITSRQLRRIIKEEKSKILTEQSAVSNADRSLGLYANTTTVDAMTDSLLNILQEVMMGLEDDGVDEVDAEMYSRAAAILAVANAFQAAGFPDVHHTLLRML
jgi:hypothetical protein